MQQQSEILWLAVMKQAQEIFENKMQDYGPAWRILRPISIADQLFIKASRVRNILEIGEQKVTGSGNDISSELLGIINYGIIGIIQNDLGIHLSGQIKYEINEAVKKYTEISEKISIYKSEYFFDKNLMGKDIETISHLLLHSVSFLKNCYQYKCDDTTRILMDIVCYGTFGKISYKDQQ